MRDRGPYVVAARLRGHAFQPDLTPIGINAPRTEHPAITVSGLADHRVENDARILQFPHPTLFLVDDFVDFLEDAV